MRKWGNVPIRRELLERIEKIKPILGLNSIAGFVNECIRLRLEELERKYGIITIDKTKIKKLEGEESDG